MLIPNFFSCPHPPFSQGRMSRQGGAAGVDVRSTYVVDEYNEIGSWKKVRCTLCTNAKATSANITRMTKHFEQCHADAVSGDSFGGGDERVLCSDQEEDMTPPGMVILKKKFEYIVLFVLHSAAEQEEEAKYNDRVHGSSVHWQSTRALFPQRKVNPVVSSNKRKSSRRCFWCCQQHLIVLTMILCSSSSSRHCARTTSLCQRGLWTDKLTAFTVKSWDMLWLRYRRMALLPWHWMAGGTDEGFQFWVCQAGKCSL